MPASGKQSEQISTEPICTCTHHISMEAGSAIQYINIKPATHRVVI